MSPEAYEITLLIKQIESLTAALASAQKALENIRDTCDEEIKTRSAGLSEKKLKNMKVLSLLIVPRNMARNALSTLPSIGQGGKVG